MLVLITRVGVQVPFRTRLLVIPCESNCFDFNCPDLANKLENVNNYFLKGCFAMKRIKILVLVGILSGLGLQSSAQAITPGPKYVSLLIQETGGYTSREWAFERTPTVLYSDGQLITRVQMQTLRYPGPMVSTFLQKREPGAVQRILNGAAKVNLADPKFDWGIPQVTDLTDTLVITQASPRGPQTKVSIYALGWDFGLIPKNKASARKEAAAFIDKVQSFSSELMWTKSRPTVWTPTKWVYLAIEAEPDNYSQVRKWFGAKPLQFTGLCKEMSVTENKVFNQLIPSLNSASRFSSNGKTWRLAVRPLFPHETGCRSIIN